MLCFLFCVFGTCILPSPSILSTLLIYIYILDNIDISIYILFSTILSMILQMSNMFTKLGSLLSESIHHSGEQVLPIIDCLEPRLADATLSPSCRTQVINLVRLEASNMDFRPSFVGACKTELHVLCPAINPGGSQLFQCVLDNISDHFMGVTCRKYLVDELRSW